MLEITYQECFDEIKIKFNNYVRGPFRIKQIKDVSAFYMLFYTYLGYAKNNTLCIKMVH